MSTLRLRGLVASLLALCVNGTLTAQDAGTLRGRVTSTDGSAVPYAAVRVLDMGRETLADATGAFMVGRLSGDSITLTVEQIGYATLDTVVALSDEAAHTLIIHPRVFALPAITATAPVPDCSVRGFRVSGEGDAVAAVMQEAAKNAVRHRLLLDNYPVDVRYVRTRRYLQPDGSVRAERVDTTVAESRSSQWAYEPGRVLDREGDGPYVIRAPSLRVIGQDRFHESHCFRYMGLDTIQGNTLHRIDFVPVESVTGPDFSGSLYLEQASSLLVRARFDVRNIPEELHFSGVQINVEYHEFLPGLLIPAVIQSHQSLRNVKYQGDRVIALVTLQTLLDHAFIGPRPGIGEPADAAADSISTKGGTR